MMHESDKLSKRLRMNRQYLKRLFQRTLHVCLCRRSVLAICLLDVWVLDSQAPDVDVVADGGDHIELEERKPNQQCARGKTNREIKKLTTKLP